MGKAKGEKQINRDSRMKEKVSKPEIKMRKIQKDRKLRCTKKKCVDLLIKHYEESTGKTVPYTQVKKTGAIKRHWEEIYEMLEADLKLKGLQGEHQLQNQTSIMELCYLKKAEHMKQDAKDMVAIAAMSVEKTESMTKPLQDIFLDQYQFPADGSFVPMDPYHFSLDGFPSVPTDGWLDNWIKEIAEGPSSGAGTSTARIPIGDAECQDPQ